MTQASGSNYSVSPITLEFILIVIATLAAACWPRPGAASFSRIERIFRPLARRRALAVVNRKCIQGSRIKYIYRELETWR
jgi:hypothetical protein